MARIVQHLTGQGLVERTPHPSDRRAAVLRLTSAGRAAVLDDRRRREAWLSRAMAAHLTDVERDLLLLAARLMERLAAS
jgi:DNA-binding MarR family transcriptional regulator